MGKVILELPLGTPPSQSTPGEEGSAQALGLGPVWVSGAFALRASMNGRWQGDTRQREILAIETRGKG